MRCTQWIGTVAVAAVAATIVVSAQDKDVVAGLSRAQLARVQTKAEEFIRDDRLAGVITVAYRHGQLVDLRAIGWQDRERRIPMRRDTIVRLASMTKPIVAAAVMILVDDGVLSLTDPLDKWLPELAHPRVLIDPEGPLTQTRPAKRPISVRDLLMYRMGHGSGGASANAPISKALAFMDNQASMTPDEWIKKLGALPLKAEPGERWMYNTSSDVMPILVQRASGMPFEQFLERRLFGPLKMKDTGFWVPPEKRSRLAASYTVDPATMKLTAIPPTSTTVTGFLQSVVGDRPPIFLSGGGGMVSTADDYLKFARMMLHGGAVDGVRILSPIAIRAMTTDYLRPEERMSSLPPDVISYPDRGFGYGVSVITTAYGLGPAEGSYGWAGASGVWWQADPKNDMIVIVLDQLYGPTKYKVQQDLTSMIYRSLLDPAPVGRVH